MRKSYNKLLIDPIETTQPKSYLDIKKSITALLYLIEKLTIDKEYWVLSRYYTSLTIVISYDTNILSLNEKSDYKSIVLGFFNRPKNNYFFEAKLLWDILKTNTQTPLSEEEIQEIKKYYLQNYIKQLEKPTNDLLELMEYCGLTYNDKNKIELYNSTKPDKWDWDILKIGYDYILENDIDWFFKEIAFNVSRKNEYNINIKRFYKEFLDKVFTNKELSNSKCFSQYKELYLLVKHDNKPRYFTFDDDCKPTRLSE